MYVNLLKPFTSLNLFISNILSLTNSSKISFSKEPFSQLDLISCFACSSIAFICFSL